MLLPAFVFMLGYIVWPLISVVDISLRDIAIPVLSKLHSEPLTLMNYAEGFTPASFWRPLKNTLIYTTAVNAPAFAIGLGLALFFNLKFPGQRIMQVICLLPWAVPGVAAASIFLWMLDGSYGVINYLLTSVGIIDSYIPWVSQPSTAMASVVVPSVWVQYPFSMLVISASLAGIPNDLYEAAKVDGASPWNRFRHITWPAVRQTAVLAGVLSCLTAIREFDTIFALTGGGPIGATETLAVRIYNEYFEYFNGGIGAALSVATTLLCVLLLVSSRRITESQFY